MLFNRPATLLRIVPLTACGSCHALRPELLIPGEVILCSFYEGDKREKSVD